MKHNSYSEKHLLKPYSKVLYNLLDKCYSIYDHHDDLSRNEMLCYKHPQFVVSFESILNINHSLKLIVDDIFIIIEMDCPFEESIELTFVSSFFLTKSEQSKVLHKAMSNLYSIVDNIQLHKINKIPCMLLSSHKSIQDVKVNPHFKSMVIDRETTCKMLGYLGDTEVYFSWEDFEGIVTEVELFSDKPPVEEQPREIELVKNPIIYF